MKINHRTIWVLLMSATLLGCQKSEIAQKFPQKHQAVSSIIPEDRCVALAKISFGEDKMRGFLLTSPHDADEENILKVEFSWTDGTREQVLECSFRPAKAS